MKKFAFLLAIKPIVLLLLSIFFFTACFSQENIPGNRISKKIAGLKQKGSFNKEFTVFSMSARSAPDLEISKIVKKYTLLDMGDITTIKRTKPAYVRFSIPIDNGGRQLRILLYKENISPNGFTLLTNTGTVNTAQQDVVNYRGSIEDDSNSVAAFTFAGNEVSGFINNKEGNYVIGKTGNTTGKHIIYNDKDLASQVPFDCSTNTFIPTSPVSFAKKEAAVAVATKCVNWYWETDYDMFVNKGSVANVNAYMQAIFNEMATLYANDGITMTLKTLFVWTAEDPYVGPNTSDYLNQFGAYRTSFDGDLAHLVGLKGSGGIAWINGLCKATKYKMAYSGISSTYKTVPTYSWSVECITHEQGHLLGSPHTHDCAWNGNNTKIDGCGDAAGYPSGTCAVPATLPVGGGTIMSYCHLTNAGINFNLGFGPQPTALMINTINAASCLVACTSCAAPSQPGTMIGNNTICSGSTQIYSVAAVSGATSYTWSLPSGWTGTSTTDSITAVAGLAGGTISVTATNSCGNSSAQTLAVTTTPLPAQPGVISGNKAVCAGSTQTYSVSAVAGATSYTWILPSGWTGTSTSNTITVTTTSGGGTISVKANNNCGSSAATTAALTITSVTPAQPVSITGNATACAGSAQTYSVAAVGGATSYTWVLPSGWTGTSATNSITATAGIAGGIVSVKANNGCGSSAVQTTTIITIALPAQPGTISGNATICAGSAQTYNVAIVAGAISYTWVLPSGWTGTSTGNTITVTTGSAGGTISVKANNSCGSSAAQNIAVTTTALPAQPGVISGNKAVCASSTQTYNVGAVVGATSYTWILPSGWTGTSTSNTISVTTGSAGGTISVKANNNCGSSAATTAALTITSVTPAQPVSITGNATACAGSAQTYSVAAVAGATSYTWVLPSGWTGTSATTSITATAGIAGGIVSVKANNGCGSSLAQTITVTTTALPAQPGTISGNTAVCAGSAQTYSVSAVAGATSYTWVLPSGWTGTSTSNTITVTTGSAGGTISVKANNSCGSSTAQNIAVTTTALPAQPGIISGNTAVCAGSTQTYSVPAVAGATSYTWVLPSGWTGTSTTNSITTTAGIAGGSISVKANNGCGSSIAQIITLAITALPAQPGTISGNTAVCAGSIQTYSVTAVAGATSYTWVLPSGWTGTSTSNTITVTTGSTGGTISVKANNSCGSSAVATAALTITSIAPAQPSGITGNTTACAGSAQTYSVTTVAGATSYTWTSPLGWSGTSTTNSITTTAGITGGIISVKANNGCGSSLAQTITVTTTALPAQPGTISGNTAVCAGSAQTYSVSAVAGATSYTWVLPSGWIGASTSNIITVTAGSASGTISVTANNSCGNSTMTTAALTITSAAPAQPGEISGSITPCAGSTQTYSVTVVPGATSYSWVLPSGWTGTSTTNSITATAGTAGGNISASASNGCGTSAVNTTAISISQLPATPGAVTMSGGSAMVCTGDSRTYTVLPVTGVTYNWIAPAGTTITNGQGTSSIQLSFSSSFISGSPLTVKAVNSCGTSVSSSSITILKNSLSRPGNISVGSGGSRVCPGDIRSYAVSAVAGITYNWTVPSGATITTGQGTNSITVTYGSNFTAPGFLSVTANSNCGTSSPSLIIISRNTLPAPGSITGPATVCPNAVNTYSVSAVPGAVSYLWTVPSGSTIQGAPGGNSIQVKSGSTAGNVSVKAVNTCGNSNARSKSVTINCTAGLVKFSGVARATVYPNPANDRVNVRFSSPDQSTYTISITDIVGKVITSENMVAIPGINLYPLNLSGFAKGIYVIVIQGKPGKQLVKVNVE